MRKTKVSQFVVAELARRKRMSKAATFARNVLGRDADNLAMIQSVADLVRASRV